jgi:AAA domain
MSGVLMLTEERPATLQEKAREAGLDLDRLHVLLRYEVGDTSWPAIVRQARDYCAANGLEILVVDTLDKWIGLRGDDESKSGAMLERIEPLLEAAADGLAVLVTTHQRKAEGTFGEAVRGSSALVGAADVVVELERLKDAGPHARVLRSTSRFLGTPEELALELTENGYVARGDVEALKARVDTDRIRQELSDAPATSKEIADAAELPEATVRRHLTEARARGGRSHRLRSGVLGAAFRASGSRGCGGTSF